MHLLNFMFLKDDSTGRFLSSFKTAGHCDVVYK